MVGEMSRKTSSACAKADDLENPRHPAPTGEGQGTDLRQVLGAQLAHHRSRQNLSKGALTRRAKVPLALITRLEQGRANPSLATIDRLAQALGVGAKALLVAPPDPRANPIYPYERFRFADGALAARCGLPEQLVAMATATADREAIVQLSHLVAERLHMRSDVRKSGETAPVRRRKVPALSDLVTVAVNMLLVCHAGNVAPPAELVRVFVIMHGLGAPPARGSQDRISQNKVLSYLVEHPNASLRATSLATKVPVSTIRHWRADPDFQSTLAGLQAAQRRGWFRGIW
jgi:transcriptional regulator with XRE-family HTH domain